MSTQLRTALDTATPDDLAEIRRVLTDAADLAELDAAPHALIYRALLIDLDTPAVTYRADLVGAAVAEPEAADVVVRDLLSIDAPLAYALARELGAATRAGRDEQRGFAARLGDINTVPEEWT